MAWHSSGRVQLVVLRCCSGRPVCVCVTINTTDTQIKILSVNHLQTNYVIRKLEEFTAFFLLLLLLL